MERLTMETISTQGIANLAAAIIVDAAKTYIGAKHSYEAQPNDRALKTLNDMKEFLRTTPWNFTGLNGDELIAAIEKEDERRRTRTA